MKKLLTLVMVILLSFAMMGCSKEGPMEKAGKKADKNVEKANKALKDLKKKAKDKLDD